MKRLSDRFTEAADNCTELAQLRELLADTALELGFQYYALLEHSSLSDPSPRRLRIDNYPQGWTEELHLHGYGADDPVHLACRRTNSGFGWSELDSLVELDRRHKKILARSRYHGLGSGFTIPSNVPGEPASSCSFAVRAGKEVPLDRIASAQLIGANALRAARRLHPHARPAARPRLSRRELECLRLLALGKTDWEIATILGIDVETVHKYVKHARSVYDTVSRTQLVVYALRDSWISFEDAIPPYGPIV